MSKWSKVLVATIIVALCASTYIFYFEMTKHKHILEEVGVEASDGVEIVLPDIDETTDFVHALADLAAAASPFLVPIVGWWVFHKTKGKVVTDDQA